MTQNEIKCPECGGLRGGHARYNCSLMTLEYAQKTIVNVEQRWIKLHSMTYANWQKDNQRLKKLIAFYQSKCNLLKHENNKLRKKHEKLN